MKGVLLIFFVSATIAASCQNDAHSPVRQCIFDSKVFPHLKNPDDVLITDLFVAGNAGVYAFREKGPHHLNQLVIKGGDDCNVIPADSSSLYIRKTISEFATRNRLPKKQEKDLEKKIQEYILDFKESTYLK